MDLITRDDLREWLDYRGQSCVSIYMPLHRAGPETQQDPIRLKNLLRDAEDRLLASGIRTPDVRALLAPATQLTLGSRFWTHGQTGLAVLIGPDFFRALRLPLTFDELVVVNDRLHLKPLLPLFNMDARFYILALSMNGNRLLEGSRYEVHEQAVEDIPKSLADTLRFDEFEEQMRFNISQASVGERGEGAVMGVIHGQGEMHATKKTNILRYFQQIDAGLKDFLGEQHVPLVLAGVEYLLPIFREASDYPYLMEEAIHGNPEDMRPDELHAEAWKIVEPFFRQEQEQAADLYQRLTGKKTGRASANLEEVVQAAYSGRVGQVFIPTDVEVWGVYDLANNKVQVDEAADVENMDLLNFIATQTLLNGGVVYAVEPDAMPEPATVAAIFRY